MSKEKIKYRYRFINFLESYEAFKRLERDVTDSVAYDDLVRIEGQDQADWLLESLQGRMVVRCHPILWHPGQALWAARHIPQLEEMIARDASGLGLRLFSGFVEQPFDVDPDLLESVVSGTVPSYRKPPASIDDILTKYT